MLQQAFLTFSTVQNKSKTVQCLSLKRTVPTYKQVSNSVILSLANHITFHFPYLDIFNYEMKLPKIIPQKNQINDYLTFHPLFQFWCQQFCRCIIKNHVIRTQNTLYIVLQVSNQQFKQIKQYSGKLDALTFQFTPQWVDQVLKYHTYLQELPRKNNKIAFLNVSGSQLRTNPFQPIINVKALVLGQIFNNEDWKSYNILKGQIPTQKQLLDFNGLIIPGSTNSVLFQIKQIKQMSQNVFNAFYKSDKLKIFGICYGHQLIAYNHKGSDVVKKKRTDKIQKMQFDVNKVNQLKQKFPFLNSLIDNKADTLLLQHHEDYVEKTSKELHVLAKSQTCKVQCMIHSTGRMLSFQSHPQYLIEFTLAYMQRLYRHYNSDYTRQNIKKQQKQQNKTHHQSSVRIRKIMSQFLNWNC